MNEQKVLELLREHRDKVLPSGREIYMAAIEKEVGANQNNSTWIKSYFSKLVESTQITAYEIYKAEERKCVSQALRSVFGKILPPNATAEDFFELLENNFWAIDQFFLSLSQSRRARAGKAFEHIIKALFDILSYPYTPHPVINGRPDFLLPSATHFVSNAMDCIIFTVKRTLRERWRQIVTEGTRGYLFFLATIDEGISQRQLGEIRNHRIYVVVPERIRSKVYLKQPNVISFEKFFELHLDPAMNRWRNAGVVE
jgi:hypothetical protein